MDQTLNTFRDLLKPDSSIPVGEQQRHAINMLPELVSRSNLSWRSPSELVNDSGDKLVIAVAAWSRQDLELLDSLDQYAAANPNIRVYVTDVDEVDGAFDQLIPGIGDVYQTPVVGRWVGGVLTEKGTGHIGRGIVRKVIATTHTPTSST